MYSRTSAQFPILFVYLAPVLCLDFPQSCGPRASGTNSSHEIALLHNFDGDIECHKEIEAFEGMREYLGSKGPYREPLPEPLPEPPTGCKAVMVTGVLRHGSRNPGKKDIKMYKKLEQKFSSVDPHLLAPHLREWLPAWRSPYELEDSHLVNTLK